MKESTLIDMKKKIESIGRILQHLINETTHLRELGVGTLETIKLMPGYEEALGKLKEQIKQNEKDGVIKQDSK
jgi:peptidyl-tRNA hydrolase